MLSYSVWFSDGVLRPITTNTIAVFEHLLHSIFRTCSVMTLKGFTFDIRLTSAVWFTVRHMPTYGAWGETSYHPALGEGKRPEGNVRVDMFRGEMSPTLVRGADLRSTGCGFESRPPRCRVQPRANRLHACASVTKQYNLVPVNGR